MFKIGDRVKVLPSITQQDHLEFIPDDDNLPDIWEYI